MGLGEEAGSPAESALLCLAPTGMSRAFLQVPPWPS